MTDAPDQPQIYLISPTEIDLMTFPDILGACLDATPVACVRLALGAKDEEKIARAADTLRGVTEQRDVALVIETHSKLVGRLGLDGVHLTDGARSVRAIRKDLGEDSIIGAFCGNSSHDGMTAGELSADYVSFGPVRETALGGSSIAELDLFQWWSQMIEVPVVAEGALDDAQVATLAPFTDFFGIGDEIWAADDPVSRLRDFVAAMA